MRLNYFLSALCLFCVLISSCDDNSYYHTFIITSPANNISYIYADETQDTFSLASTDNYTVYSNADWIKILSGDETSQINYSYGSIYQGNIRLNVDANTSGKTRIGYVKISTSGDDDWDQTSQVSVVQYGWLNVIRPNVETSSDGFVCEVTDSASQVSDELRFVAHGPWSITESANSKVHPGSGKTSGNAGTQIISLTLDPNESVSDTVVSTLVLTSNGVSMPVVYKQAPRTIQ